MLQDILAAIRSDETELLSYRKTRDRPVTPPIRRCLLVGGSTSANVKTRGRKCIIRAAVQTRDRV